MAIKQLSPDPGRHIMVDPLRYAGVSANWFERAYWQRQGNITGQAKGRGTTVFVRYGDEELVLRHYRRGGLPGKLLSDQYLFTGIENTRPFREFRLLCDMQNKGLNVPRPVAAQVVKKGLIYRGDLITAMIPGSEDLHAILTRKALRPECWHQVGAAVARMHDAGVYHHDLNIRNILIDATGEVWIIDFDRCEFRAGNDWKESNIARFRRSLEKEKTKTPALHWDFDDWDAFNQGLQAA